MGVYDAARRALPAFFALAPWNRVRCAPGLGKLRLYTATRHCFGWHALNIARLEPHVIALQLVHRDGGALVRKVYGHPDAAIARECIREAFSTARTAKVPPPDDRGPSWSSHVLFPGLFH